MARSGQVTVTTAGTAVQGTTVSVHLVAIKAHPDNTDAIWVGSDDAGDVTSSNGFPLDPGETVVVELGNLDDLWFDADVNGEKACWLALD
jgi:hypothetical protein